MTDMPIPDEPSTSAARPRERRARPAVRPGSASPLGRLTGGWTWRKGAVAGVLLLLVGTACVLGYRRWNTAPAKEATVQTAPATKRTILEQVALPGTVASGRQSKLAFASSSSGTSVTGRVESISVKTGDTVKAGQELARLNTTSLDLAVQSANSAFTVAQLKLQQLLAGATRSDLATAEQSIIGANATLQKAQSDLRTLQGAPAAAEYASATQAVLNAQNALNNAQTTLDNLQVHSSDAAALANAIKAVDAMTAQQHTAQTELDAGLDQLEAANAFSKGVRGAANDLLNAVNAMCRSNATQCNGIARGATDLASLGTGLDAQLPPIPFAISPRVVAFNEATTDPALRSALFRLVQASAELPALTTEANGRVAVSGSSSAPTNEALRSAMSTRDAAAQALTAANAKLDLLMHPADADVQAAQNALKNAQAGLAAATAKRDATVGGPLPVDIAVQEQSVQQAQVNQQKAQDDRQGAVLVAPYDGVVGAITMNVGETSGTGAIVLIDPNAMRLQATAPESSIAKIKAGQTAALSFDAYPGTIIPGIVDSVAPDATVTQGVAAYAVVIRVNTAAIAAAAAGATGAPGATPGATGTPGVSRTPGAGGTPGAGAAGRPSGGTGAASSGAATAVLRSGMTGTGTIEIQRFADVLAVPSKAVRREGRTSVVTVVANGKQETKTVTIGVTDASYTQITSGLNEGEVVVTSTTAVGTVTPSGTAAATGAGGLGGAAGAGGAPVINPARGPGG